MLAGPTLGCYALFLLIVPVAAVRWICRHDPVLREDWSPSRESAMKTDLAAVAMADG